MLDNETCIILIDFAENYSFLVQDAIQSFCWQNQQATLHPFAVYHNDDYGKLNVAVIVSYQIIYCMIRLQFTVLFH